MRTLATFLVLFLLVAESFGQIKFEKGYLINNDHQRIECWIKNLEWKNNPTEFSYKLTESAAPVEGNLATVREFGIANYSKFVNAMVKIDRQIKPVVGAKNELTPDWTRERLFLKVILEGKAKLYSYDDNKLKRFFYSLNDTLVTQLVYLETLKGTTLVKNTSYQQQLWSSVKAPNATMNSIKEVDYTQKDLSEYFKTYNEALGGTNTEIIPEKKGSYFNLKLVPGFNSSSVSTSMVVDATNAKSKVDFGSKSGFQAGLEAELIVPFNKYRWGILFEPTFQSYSSDATGKYGSSTIKYSAVDFPIGLRYYFPVNEHTSVFLNGFVIPGFAINLNSNVGYYVHFSNTNDSKTLDLKSSASAALGGGVEFNRVSLEARYYTNRNLLDGQAIGTADYSRFSIVLGYKFVKTRF